MIDFLAKILGYVMQGCYWLTNNYVVSLLLFALAMQLLLCPFGIKQQKNMVKQASIRPKEMAIRSKYKGRNDQVTLKKMQNEIMELYQREGYSQVAGCLPMLFQLIIIFPLYQVVIRPLEFVSGLSEDVCAKLYTALFPGATASSTAQIEVISKLKGNPSLIGTLSSDLQSAIGGKAGIADLPDVSLFGVDLGVTPGDSFGESYWWLVFIPLLNLGFMYLSQFISKKLSYQNPQAEQMNNSSMKIMMLVLPLMTMFITFQFAAAIGIYWIFRTILSIGQQYLFYKLMPYPQFTEEDYKKAEFALKGKHQTKKGKASYTYQPGQYHSLHHDD